MRNGLKASAAALLVGSAVVFLAAPAVAAAPVVKIATGSLRGARDGRVEAFKGIPFAAPPIGNLRWRAPQPAASWTGVRDATAFGHDCMQEPFPKDDAPLTTKPAEDCLYLNVWRPAQRSSAKLPVIVWIYGGGFINGGTSANIYDGSAFARDGIIYVSFNYRLGRFGYFGFPELTRQDADHGLLGNYTIMDLIAGLKWVQANIASFGGDPSNVTIFGESAGGSAVSFLMTSPLSRGLFARSVIQSGGGHPAVPAPRRLSQDLPEVPSSETLGVNFARQNGINGTDAAALAALRSLPAEKLVNGMQIGAPPQPDTYGGPTIDGRIVVEEQAAAYAANRAAPVPVMIGANSGDIGSIPGSTKDELFANFGSKAAAARAAYDPDGTKPLEQIRAEAGMASVMIEPARAVARQITANGQPVHEYRFSYTATPRRPTSPYGAPHATEIPFIMDTVSARYGSEATEQDQAVARIMHAYWLNFAMTGDPNGPGLDGKPLPQWPVYSSSGDVIMDFEPDGDAVAKPDPLKAQLDAVEGLNFRR